MVVKQVYNNNKSCCNMITWGAVARCCTVTGIRVAVEVCLEDATSAVSCGGAGATSARGKANDKAGTVAGSESGNISVRDAVVGGIR